MASVLVAFEVPGGPCFRKLKVPSLGAEPSLEQCQKFTGATPLSTTTELEPGMSRVTRSKDEARASYDRLSRWYDWLSGPAEARCRDAGLRMLAAREGESVLEIGFGTGHALLALARAVGPTGMVYGIDLSPGMLGLAQQRVRAAGLSERVELTCGDGVRLPLETNKVDAVFTSFTLELFDTPEIPQVLAECGRVLREGGRVAVVALSATEKPGAALRLYEWAHARFPRFVDCRPIFLAQAVRAAGFQVVNEARMTMARLLPVSVLVALKGNQTAPGVSCPALPRSAVDGTA